ncbi:hypothetical protein [Synoicihabitans lomoniglobus]|uniref:Uncharacterized protein n=1 Tax=Synoicihabitans lomoniglobus TaxID=2909285 RepID=A0AAE9ZWP7_9BACT|nr:hypothetical protein [Opitutaceae bacterium LMO-M01]WED64811.1 hypothetical protein PXH66_20900 [Opitutaceae bacterium LMO-M01]
MPNKFEPIGERIWCGRFDLKVFGAPLGKRTTVMQLSDGGLVVHSAAPFSTADARALREIGEPRWLLECSRAHDTFAQRLRKLFPEATYVIPPKFPLTRDALAPASPWSGELPAGWKGEIEVQRIGGIPLLDEHAVYHGPSRTLILSDLVFNLSIPDGERIPFFLRWVSGITSFPATSRLIRMLVRDRAALKASLESMLAWDFERVVVGHGEMIVEHPRVTLGRVLDWSGIDQVP